MALTSTPVEARGIEAFSGLIDPPAFERLRDAATAAADTFSGRTIWNVNTTARGGGVAEMLEVLLAYVRGAGVDTRWMVLEGDPTFFTVTKRLHNGFHGSAGDGGPLGADERAHYEHVTGAGARTLLDAVRPGDIVILHDPQTAGMAPWLADGQLQVVWRSHIAAGVESDPERRAWDFVRPYLEAVDAFVFSRPSYVPPWLADRPVEVIPPSIDPFSAKNQDLSRAVVSSIVVGTGLVADPAATAEPPVFARRDGSPGRVERYTDVLRCGPPPTLGSPLVVQVSRWDRLKDMQGVMEAFAEHVDPRHGAHLLLAGPNVSSVADDPEGVEVLEECQAAWRSLPHVARSRVAIACLPMADLEENAAIVNAVQRHATVVVQKSLAEGFGLTVAEAMWKTRPVVASAVGGIADQIVDGESGILLDDPADHRSFATALDRVLADADLAATLGREARQRVTERYLSNRHLLQYAELLVGLAG